VRGWERERRACPTVPGGSKKEKGVSRKPLIGKKELREKLASNTKFSARGLKGFQRKKKE